jgi:MYXO-CTERM domain-containing protein
LPGPGGVFVGNASNTGFANQQIVLWALQSSNNSSLAAAEGSVLQQAIAYVPKDTTPIFLDAWNFPGDPGIPIAIDARALLTSGSQVLAGTFIPNANNASLASNGFGVSNNALQLATVVPEAATITFVAMAGLAAAGGWRRRRRE